MRLNVKGLAVGQREVQDFNDRGTNSLLVNIQNRINFKVDQTLL